MTKLKSKDLILIQYEEGDNLWYEATVLECLSSQFTCMWGEKGERHGYFFYKEEGVTWKKNNVCDIQ